MGKQVLGEPKQKSLCLDFALTEDRIVVHPTDEIGFVAEQRRIDIDQDSLGENSRCKRSDGNAVAVSVRDVAEEFPDQNPSDIDTSLRFRGGLNDIFQSMAVDPRVEIRNVSNGYNLRCCSVDLTCCNFLVVGKVGVEA